MKGPRREGGREGWMKRVVLLGLGVAGGAQGAQCLQRERTLSSNNSLIQQSYAPLAEHGQHKRIH